MPSTSRDRSGKSALYLLAHWVSFAGGPYDICPIASGRIVVVARGSTVVPSLSASAAAALTPSLSTTCRIAAAAVAGRGARELPLRDRRIGGVDDVVEHRRREEAARRRDGVVAAPFDAREDVALVGPAAGAAVGDAHQIADVVAQKRHPGAPERGHDHARQPAADVDQLDVRVARVVVQAAGGALHEEHAGLGGAVELERRRRRHGRLHRAQAGARGLLVGERDEGRRVHGDASAPAPSGTSPPGTADRTRRRRAEDRSTRRPCARARASFHSVGSAIWFKKSMPSTVRSSRRERADVTGRAAAHRRRQHRLAEAAPAWSRRRAR